MALALVAFGANIGDSKETLTRAIGLLAEQPEIVIGTRSRWYRTMAVGGPVGQDDFMNGALTLETTLVPLELLAVLYQVEQQLGRKRRIRWDARTLDLDLLLYEAQTLSQEGLLLPHPRMTFRRFVMQPAVEVAPKMIHPVLRCRLKVLLQRLEAGPERLLITGGTEQERGKVQSRVQAIAAQRQAMVGTAVSIKTEAVYKGTEEAKLHISLDRYEDVLKVAAAKNVLTSDSLSKEPQQGLPTLWVGGYNSRQVLQEIQAAFESVWPAKVVAQ